MARVISMSDAINEAMKLAMRKDDNVLVIGEDVAGGAAVDHLQDDEAWGGVLGVTKGLVQEFGRSRVLDTPISEAGYMGAAMAAASTGLRPIAELMFNDFIGTCPPARPRPSPLYRSSSPEKCSALPSAERRRSP